MTNMNTNNSNALDFEDPGSIPNELLDCPGFIHELTDYTMAVAPRPNKVVAFAGSLAMMSHLSGRSYRDEHGTGTRAAKMNEMILRFFSEAKSGHVLRQKANDGTVKIIPQPHLTLFATGIPKFFYSAMTPKALENGLLGHCLFFDSEDFMPFGEQQKRELPENCVKTANKLAEIEQNILDSGEIHPIIVEATNEAKCKIKEMKFNCDEITRRLLDSKLTTAAALYVRLPEKTQKLAMLYAISENPDKPVISIEAVTWALKLVTHLTKRMLYLSQFYVAEGAFDRLKKRAVGLLADAPDHQMTRSELLRSLTVDAGTLNKVLMTLHMCDMIEEELVSRRKSMITLKMAA